MGLLMPLQGTIEKNGDAQSIAATELRGLDDVSVVKKRGGLHERTIREFGMGDRAIRVGEALRQFRGVLTGVPVYEGSQEPLLGTERRA